MARAYRVRPSELLGLADEAQAFSFDRAVWTFATAVEADMEAAEKRLPKSASEALRSSTRQRVWDSYMGINTATTPGRYADPASKVKRRR